MNVIPRLRPLLVYATRQALRPDLPDKEIEGVINDALAHYETERASIPSQRSPTGTAMVHLAALTAGLYHALQPRSEDLDDAKALTARVTGFIYDKMAIAPTLISHIGKRDRGMERATRTFRAFPFRPPDYEMVDRPASPGVVAFDVVRCPVAEYFVSRGLGELCKTSWCDLDYALARRWGGHLVRTTTIAEGAARCDFRWHVDENRADSPPFAPATPSVHRSDTE